MEILTHATVHRNGRKSYTASHTDASTENTCNVPKEEETAFLV